MDEPRGLPTHGRAEIAAAREFRARLAASVTRERIEHAMDVVARIMVENDWPQIAPLLDRRETELAKFERGDDPIARAAHLGASRRRAHAREL